MNKAKIQIMDRPNAVRYTVLVGRSGEKRMFSSFEAAECWARRIVGESRNDRFAARAAIFLNALEIAEVSLDGCGRVWTDMKECADA